MDDARDKLKNALKELLKTKPYEKITVTELCKQASVSRRTFYNNFVNIDTIVDTIVYDDFIAPPLVLRGLLPVDEIESSVILMIEMNMKTLYENQDFYKAVLHFKGQNSLIKTIVGHVRAFNKEVYRKFLGDTEENEFVAYLFAWSPAIALLWWIEYEGQTDPKTMAKYLDQWTFAHWRTLRE